MSLDELLRTTGDRLNRQLEHVPVPPLPRHHTGVRRAVALAASMVLLGLAVVAAVWLLRPGSDTTPVVNTQATSPPVSDDVPVVVPPVDVSVPLAGVQGTKVSGGFLWAWNDTEIWRYDEGRWSAFATFPTAGFDLAYDGTALRIWSGGRLLSLDGSRWAELGPVPPGIGQIEADAATGTLWASDGTDLYRWDGGAMVDVGHPTGLDADSGEGYVGEIAVTEDGGVWAAGLYGYVPEWGGLARYDDDTASWELVRPLGGSEDVPAQLMASAPDGGFWVMLADWFGREARDERTAAGLPPATLTLVHRDAAARDWSVLPDGYRDFIPYAMAASSGAAWLAQGCCSAEGFDPLSGVIRVDAESSARYLTEFGDNGVSDVVVAPDGTVWYLYEGRLTQLDTESGPG